MIGRLLPGPHIAVDPDLEEAVAGLWRQQQMIDPQALVLLPGAGLIIPEGVLARGVGDRAQRVGQARPSSAWKLSRVAGLNRASLTQARDCGRRQAPGSR